MTLQETESTYRDYLIGSKSNGTAAMYLHAFRRFIEAAGDKDIDRIDLTDFIKFKAQLVQKGLSSSYIATELSALICYIKFLKRIYTIRTVDVMDVQDLRPSIVQTIPEAFERSQLDEFVEAAQDIEDRTVIELLFHTGMRISELLFLTRDRIITRVSSHEGQETTETWIKIMGKGKKERMIPLNDRATRVLKEYLEYLDLRYKGRTRLFTKSYVTVWRRLKAIGFSAGAKDALRPHVLRHSCATELYEQTEDLNVIARLLGHSSLNTTKRYAKVKDKGLAKAVKLLDQP